MVLPWPRSCRGTGPPPAQLSFVPAAAAGGGTAQGSPATWPGRSHLQTACDEAGGPVPPTRLPGRVPMTAPGARLPGPPPHTHTHILPGCQGAVTADTEDTA